MGWLPVGPCDRFYPWYGRYGSRFNSVNVVNITNINIHNGPGRGFGGFAPLRSGNGYSNLRLATVNERVRQGISTVPADRFGTGRQAPGSVSREEFNKGRMMAGNLPVVPTREALSASNRPAAASTLRRGGQSERFFTKSQPRPAPQSFDRQRAEVQQAIQRNGQFKPINGDLSRGGVNAARPGQNSVGGASADAARGSGIPRPNPGVRMGARNTGMNSAVARHPWIIAQTCWRPRFECWTEPDWRSEPACEHPWTLFARIRPEIQMSVRGDESGRSANDSGGWRRFSDSPSSQRGAGAQWSDVPFARRLGCWIGFQVPRPENSVRQGSSGSDGGWRQFTPQPRGTMERGSMDRGAMERSGPQNSGGVSQRLGWAARNVSRFSPSGLVARLLPAAVRDEAAHRDSVRFGRGGAGPSRGSYPSRGGAGGGNGGGGHSQPSGGGGAATAVATADLGAEGRPVGRFRAPALKHARTRLDFRRALRSQSLNREARLNRSLRASFLFHIINK